MRKKNLSYKGLSVYGFTCSSPEVAFHNSRCKMSSNPQGPNENIPTYGIVLIVFCAVFMAAGIIWIYRSRARKKKRAARRRHARRSSSRRHHGHSRHAERARETPSKGKASFMHEAGSIVLEHVLNRIKRQQQTHSQMQRPTDQPVASNGPPPGSGEAGVPHPPPGTGPNTWPGGPMPRPEAAYTQQNPPPTAQSMGGPAPGLYPPNEIPGSFTQQPPQPWAGPSRAGGPGSTGPTEPTGQRPYTRSGQEFGGVPTQGGPNGYVGQPQQSGPGTGVDHGPSQGAPV